VFLNFPRDVADPKRQTVTNVNDFKSWLKRRNGVTDCFISVYGDRQKIIDKIFIDIDAPYDEMMKLHRWLEARNYKHTIFFSGGGYHIYVFTERANLSFPKNALRTAQIYLTDESGVNADRQVFGDVKRVARIPNTFNPKRGLYCIPLGREDIEKGENYIKKIAHQQHRVKDVWFGEKLFSLEPFDQEPMINKLDWEIDDDVETMTITNEMIKSFSPCILAMLKKENTGHRDRFIIIAYMKERGFLIEEVIDVLKRFLSPKVFHHSVFVERQVHNIFEKDLMVPTCDNLKKEGRCAMPENCTAHQMGTPI
jgi:hypothetical protein